MGEENKDVNSIIITGAGDFFCAGGDLNGLKTRRSMTEDERYSALGQLNGTIHELFHLIDLMHYISHLLSLIFLF